MEFTHRFATISDLDILLEFEQGIMIAERPLDSRIDEGDIHYYDLKKYIQSAHADVIIIEDQYSIIGSCFIREDKALDYHRHDKEAYVGFVYVRPEYRGQGVNQLIMQLCFDWARSRQIYEIRLEVIHGNESAIRAYEKAGFTPRLVEMCLRID